MFPGQSSRYAGMIDLCLARAPEVAGPLVAEASDVAGRALEAARAAQAGWSANTSDARAAAVDAARGAAEAAEGCHRLLRAVNK